MFVFQVFKEFKPKHVLQMKSSQAPKKVPLFNKFKFLFHPPIFFCKFHACYDKKMTLKDYYLRLKEMSLCHKLKFSNPYILAA